MPTPRLHKQIIIQRLSVFGEHLTAKERVLLTAGLNRGNPLVTLDGAETQTCQKEAEAALLSHQARIGYYKSHARVGY